MADMPSLEQLIEFFLPIAKAIVPKGIMDLVEPGARAFALITATVTDPIRREAEIATAHAELAAGRSPSFLKGVLP